MSDTPRVRNEGDLTRRGRLPGVRPAEHGPLDTTVVDAKRAVTPGTTRLAEELAPGTRIKHYEIIRELGRGGMARVVVARDLKLGRKVALKVLDSDSSEFTARFLVEARATARCSHENIVIIHEVDEYQGTPYMVLELLDGQSLASFLAAGTVSPRRAVEIVVPVVAALVHAHALDIVHRDLKPDNIFVTARGGIKVLDFGIAKLFAGPTEHRPAQSAGGDGAHGRPELGVLSAGGPALSGFAGTMPYMAPEQWGVHEIDHRADIWAVGIILWQLLAGRHPLDPLTREKLFAMAGMPEEPMPSIASAIPSLPSELERIVDRCLAKRVEDRHASARELLEALLKLIPGHGRSLSEHESPYLGLRAFQESDADRFFGRSGDVRHFIERIRELPLVGVVGPSGVGKSSFVQAGIVPALRASSEEWEVLVVRPGRDPLASLAALIDPASSTGPERGEPATPLHQRLREEPGYLGVALRRRAQRKGARVLLFVDQFEELYALVGDPALRQAFTACVAGVADDWSSPLRVVLSMRSDFVDRVAEDRVFMQQLARGLVFLPPPDRDGLREALIQPLDAVGFRFEDPDHRRGDHRLAAGHARRAAAAPVRVVQAVGGARPRAPAHHARQLRGGRRHGRRAGRARRSGAGQHGAPDPARGARHLPAPGHRRGHARHRPHRRARRTGPGAARRRGSPRSAGRRAAAGAEPGRAGRAGGGDRPRGADPGLAHPAPLARRAARGQRLPRARARRGPAVGWQGPARMAAVDRRAVGGGAALLAPLQGRAGRARAGVPGGGAAARDPGGQTAARVPGRRVRLPGGAGRRGRHRPGDDPERRAGGARAAIRGRG